MITSKPPEAHTQVYTLADLDDFRELLPPPEDIFATPTLYTPPVAIRILRRTLQLYEIDPVPHDVETTIQFSQHVDTRNSRFQNMLWLAEFLQCPRDLVHNMADRYFDRRIPVLSHYQHSWNQLPPEAPYLPTAPATPVRKHSDYYPGPYVQPYMVPTHTPVANRESLSKHHYAPVTPSGHKLQEQMSIKRDERHVDVSHAARITAAQIPRSPPAKFEQKSLEASPLPSPIVRTPVANKHGIGQTRRHVPASSFPPEAQSHAAVTHTQSPEAHLQSPVAHIQPPEAHRHSSLAHSPSPVAHTPSQIPSKSSDESYLQSKKASAVEAYFHGRKFKGDTTQSLKNLLRDFDICATQQGLTERQRVLFFVNALDGNARDYYLAHCHFDMPIREVFQIMHRQYNSESRQLQAQTKMENLKLADIMTEHTITDTGQGLQKLIDTINTLAPQLPKNFADDAHKARYLRLALINVDWARQPIADLATQRYSFAQFVHALQANLQLHNESRMTSVTDTHLSQFVAHPRDVRSNKVAHTRRPPFQGRDIDRRRNRTATVSRYKTNGRQGNSRARDDRGPRINPTLRHGRFCWGCGSRDHILSDRKCTPTLQSIRTNFVEQGLDDENCQELVQILHTNFGHTSGSDSDQSLSDADEVRFVEEAEQEHESDALKAQITSYFDTHFMRDMNTNRLRRKHHTRPRRKSNWRLKRNVSLHRLGRKQDLRKSPMRVYDCSTIDLKSIKRTSNHPAFCVDIGAPRSVIGKKELMRIMRHYNKQSIPVMRSRNAFRFGDSVAKSRGIVELFLDTPNGTPPLPVLLDIVDVNIPALLGLDILDGYSLNADTVSNRLIHRIPCSKSVSGYTDDWSVQMMRMNDHVYARMIAPSFVFYSTRTLRKLHQHFSHPSAEKLFNLLQRAGDKIVTAKTLKKLQDISARCDPCQRVKNAPRRFRVTVGHEDTRFNAIIFMDIFYLDGKPVLHIVDDATHFSAARFMPRVSTAAIWEALVLCWTAIYTGLPHTIMVDAGSVFRETFAEIAELHDVKTARTGVQSHNSLGIGERYHKPLRDTYRKMRVDFPSMPKPTLLAIAVKAINDTLGPEGIVPSALVFGEFPSIRNFLGPKVPRATLAERAEVALEARKLMSKHMAMTKVRRALTHQMPSAANHTYAPGDKVLVFREKVIENRIGEWQGPFTVMSYDQPTKTVLVQDEPGSSFSKYNVTQVKPYVEPTDTPKATAVDFVSHVARALSDYQSPPEAHEVCMTEVITPEDPRATNTKMREAIEAEVQDLLRRGTFRKMRKRDIPPEANVLTARFVLAIKSDAEGHERYKARYVMGGHRDQLKLYLVHDTQTLQQPSVRVILVIAAAEGYDVWISDVKLAYLQSGIKMKRKIYIRNPAPEFGLEEDECFELLLPLYGLGDAGDMWHKTIKGHLEHDLGMHHTIIDPALHFSSVHASGDNTCASGADSQIASGVHSRLIGLNGTYVDDLLRAGTNEFRQLCQKTHRRFETKGDEELPQIFAGFNIARSEQSGYTVDQQFYYKRLEELSPEATFSDFASMRKKLAWLSHTRPDCLVDISQLNQVAKGEYDHEPQKIIKRINGTIRYLKSHLANISFPKIDLASARLIAYSDAAFANNSDLTSQLGRIILLCDANGNAAPLAFKSYKSRRVTRSVLAAEVIAFSDTFDDALALRALLEQLLSRAVPLQMLTDSKSLFDVIACGSRTSEKRIMLDIVAAREGYASGEISNIGFVRSDKNLADGLTKPKMQAAIFECMSTAKHIPAVEQWIIRDTTG